MQKWEYLARFESEGFSIDRFLNQLGPEGWELVTVVVDPQEPKRLIHYFKRPVL